MLATAPLAEEMFRRPTTASLGMPVLATDPHDRRLVIGGRRDLRILRTARSVAATHRCFRTERTAVQVGIESGAARVGRRGRRDQGNAAPARAGFARDGRPGWSAGSDATHHLARWCAASGLHWTAPVQWACPRRARSTPGRAAEPEARASGIATFDPGRFPEPERVRGGIAVLGAAADAWRVSFDRGAPNRAPAMSGPGARGVGGY